VTRATGAFSAPNAFSARIAAISAPTPAVRAASCTTTARPVFFTEARSVASSSGLSERRSITSADVPCSASASAAARQLCTVLPYEISETSEPSRRTLAFPRGSTTSSSGTSPGW
jgi:hypothetical protein